MPIPPVTREPILHVDATPGEDYPLRILRAYRANCDVRWARTARGEADPTDPLLAMMNRAQVARAAILDRAIATLEGS
mgnify:CR=1 FL=1